MDVDGRIRRDGNWALSRLRRPGVLHSTQEVRRFSPLHTIILKLKTVTEMRRVFRVISVLYCASASL